MEWRGFVKKAMKSINILGHSWSVEYVTESKLPHGASGICIFNNRSILILKDMTSMIAKLTLLHELRHAMQFECGLTNVLDNQALEMDADSFASFVMSLKKQKVL